MTMNRPDPIARDDNEVRHTGDKGAAFNLTVTFAITALYAIAGVVYTLLQSAPGGHH